jgi:hypothetical protein
MWMASQPDLTRVREALGANPTDSRACLVRGVGNQYLMLEIAPMERNAEISRALAALTPASAGDCVNARVKSDLRGHSIDYLACFEGFQERAFMAGNMRVAILRIQETVVGGPLLSDIRFFYDTESRALIGRVPEYLLSTSVTDGIWHASRIIQH